MEVFGMPFIEVIVAIFLAVIAVITVKIAISFDVNKYLENRHDRRKERLKILCPHTLIEKNKTGQFVARSLFHTSFGTTAWICSRCGMQTHDDAVVKNSMNYYAENIYAWTEREKKFQCLAQKMYKYK